MAPKKKPAGNTGDDTVDLSTEKFMKEYRQNCTKIYDIPVCKNVDEQYKIYKEDQTDFKKFHFWE